MKIKKKKPSFGIWLLSNPKAFQVTMLIGAIGGTVIFGSLAILGWIVRWNMAITIIWTVFALLSGWKSYKYLKTRRMLGDEQFSNYTLGDFMSIQQVKEQEDYENGRERYNGEQSEKFCSEQSNANDEQPVSEEYQGTPRRVLESEEEPESADDSFFDLIQESNEDEPKL